MIRYVLEYKSKENPDAWNIACEYLSSEFSEAKTDCLKYMELPLVIAARIVCIDTTVMRTEFGRCEKNDAGNVVKSGLLER